MMEREWAAEIRRTCAGYLDGTYTRGETLSFLLRILGALRNEQEILSGVARITPDDGLRESFVAWVHGLPDREEELMAYRGRELPAPGTITRLKQALTGNPPDRKYRYVGPPEIAAAAKGVAPGFALRGPGDVREWLKHSRADFDRSGRVIQTFVVSEAGSLLIADRRSEHVACAGGAAVLAAGEITFLRAGAGVEAEEVTNQSTGYCPEPASWKAVAEALARAGIRGPKRYTTEFIFRRCENCGQINLVKDGIFLCAVCERPLPSAWNFDGHGAQG